MTLELRARMLELEAALVLAVDAAARMAPLTPFRAEWEEWADDRANDALGLRATREEWAA